MRLRTSWKDFLGAAFIAFMLYSVWGALKEWERAEREMEVERIQKLQAQAQQ